MNYRIIEEKFIEIFKEKPLLVRSPGRINLIGEHTDYNEGFVLPAAIDKEIVLAFSKNETNVCHLFSADYKESFTFDLDDFAPLKSGWANYVMGVANQFKVNGHFITGFNCVFGGNIPIGAGLSSSAALECGVAFGLNKLFNLGIDKISLIKYAQKAEHEFAGVMCGIMDQFASTMGKQGHALRLDCRTLEYKHFPLHLGDYQFLLLDTQVKHSLADSEYNTRRKECEQGVSVVKGKNKEVRSLRDIPISVLEEFKNEISPLVYKRCSYIIEENERLLKGCNFLEAGDIKGFGEQMYASHEGLSLKYEVSCQELDFLVNYTKDKNFVLGSRMMGGGFGGCTINLIAKSEKDDFISDIKNAYSQKFARDLQAYEVVVSDGTTEVDVKK